MFTEGICGDGAAILNDGVMVPISEILERLNASVAMETLNDVAANKLIPDYDKELARKLVSIGVSRGALWSRCMSVRAIVEANPIPA